MRLVHLGSPVGLPTRQAHAVQMTKMCEAFSGEGWDTCLLYADPPVDGVRLDAAALRKFYDLETDYRMVPLRCFDLRSAKQRFARLRQSLRELSYAVNAVSWVLRNANDAGTVIYSRERFSSYLLLLLKSRVRAIHVFESHNFIAERRAALIIRLLKKLDRLVVTTPFIGERYEEAGIPAERIVTVPNGVDVARFDIQDSRADCRSRTLLPADRPVVGYVGNFRNTMGMEKGVACLVSAFAELVKRPGRSNELLVCVGGPEDCLDEYRKLAFENQLDEGSVWFPGYVNRADVPYWLRACDVLLIPWPMNEWAAYQTSPIKLFEYMASGTPIVATDLPSLRVVLEPGRNALLAKPGDISSLADAIETVLDDPDGARLRAAEALRDVASYTWAVRARRVLAGLAPG
jgi:glycosyltransferase involved in cell wall biosynthesis